MAASARELRYRRTGQAVNGSLAYDMDWTDGKRQPGRAGEQTRVRERTQVRKAAVPKVKVRERQYVSPVAVAGVSAVLVMAVALLLSYIQLTMVAADTVALKQELTNLESECQTLTVEYEQMFDLTSVREAAEAAGMSKPSASQVCYLSLNGGDRAIICEQTETTALGRLLEQARQGIQTVKEYFT